MGFHPDYPGFLPLLTLFWAEDPLPTPVFWGVLKETDLDPPPLFPNADPATAPLRYVVPVGRQLVEDLFLDAA